MRQLCAANARMNLELATIRVLTQALQRERNSRQHVQEQVRAMQAACTCGKCHEARLRPFMPEEENDMGFNPVSEVLLQAIREEERRG